MPWAPRRNDKPNTFAPEGASRCRALTSGLRDRAAGRKERLSDELAALKPRRPQKSRKVAAGWRFREPRRWAYPLAKAGVFDANRAMSSAEKTYSGPASDHF